MFAAHRDLVTELKQNDAHFARLFDEHNALDEKITNMENDPVASHRHEEIETLKKEKLHLKDELYQIITKAIK